MTESSSTSGKADHVQCVACGSEVIPGAKLCPVCKSYQSPVKAFLYQYGPIAGFATVVISLLTYMAATFPEIRKTFAWRDSVNVIAFNSQDHLVLQNSGDGDVFVSHMLYQSAELGFSTDEPINETIKEKSFLVHKMTPDDTSDDATHWHTMKLSDDQWKNLMKRKPLNDNCYQWTIFHEFDPHFQNMQRSLNGRFRTLPVDGFLIFHSGQDGRPITRRMSLRAVPFKNDSTACAQKEP